MYVKYVPDPEVIRKFFAKVIRGEATMTADNEIPLEGKMAKEKEWIPETVGHIDVSYATPHEVLKEFARSQMPKKRKVQKRKTRRQRVSRTKATKRSGSRSKTKKRSKRSTTSRRLEKNIRKAKI